MRIGVIVSPAAGWSYAQLSDFARGAEAAGFDSFWVSDHFFAGQGVPDRDCLEAWTVLAGLARDTHRIRLGVLVAAVQYRNPALLAKIAAGVDQMSGGRLEFGVGAGWKEDEYRAYGYDYQPAGARVEQLRDALEITRRLWSEDRVTYQGKHYRVEAAVSAPKPAQRPRPPIWVGGAQPRVMRLAARYADGFDLGKHGQDGGDLSPEQMTAAFAELAAIERGVKRERPLLRSHWSPSSLEGGAKSLLSKIRAYASAGLDQYLCAFPKERVTEMIDRSARELVPEVAGLS